MKSRPTIPVAAGCIADSGGRVLIAQRPLGKIAAGKWEFPGGKIESGESPRAALARELREELGIEVRAARPLIRVRHDYSDRSVILDTWLVSRFAGEPHPHDEQALAWVAPDEMHRWDLLAADKPIVTALRLPTDYVFTPPQLDLARVLDGLERLPRGALLRLRWPQLDAAAYEAAAAQVMPAARRAGLRVVLDRSLEMAHRLGADGWHATARALSRFAEQGLASSAPGQGGRELWRFASCHSAEELQLARLAGFDAAVLGSVRATATHPGQEPLGWDDFERLAGEAALPVFAIGGVGPEQSQAAFEHYAQGVAGISAYW